MFTSIKNVASLLLPDHPNTVRDIVMVACYELRRAGMSDENICQHFASLLMEVLDLSSEEEARAWMARELAIEFCDRKGS